jgi:Sigma-70, region 4
VAHDRAGADELVGLSEALRDLPTRQRRALVLRDWHGLSYNEIAAELAVSVASVETLLFRGRKKIAAALSNADWSKAAPSARALLIWPFAFLRTKSAATAGAEHLKLGLVLAGGAVAPLVAFGVVQSFLPGQTNQPPQSARTPPVVEIKSALASGSAVGESRLLRVARSTARTDKTRRHSGGAGQHVAAAKSGGRSKSPGASPTKAGPPAAPAGKSNKVVLCHKTQSKKNPGVTISVSGNALGGLSKDSPGAC